MKDPIQIIRVIPPLNGKKKKKKKKGKIIVLEWLSQSPDLDPIKMRWQDLKQAIHA